MKIIDNFKKIFLQRTVLETLCLVVPLWSYHMNEVFHFQYLMFNLT